MGEGQAPAFVRKQVSVQEAALARMSGCKQLVDILAPMRGSGYRGVKPLTKTPNSPNQMIRFQAYD